MSIVQSQQQNNGIVKPSARVKDLLEQMKPQLAAVLPKHLTPDRLIKVVMTAAIKTPQIYDCTRESLMQSVMLAAQLGLDCGGALGSAYLIPYKKSYKDECGNWQKRLECQLIIGYRGMIDLARRSGQIASINARAVFKGDKFIYEFGLDDRLVHTPLVEPTAEGLTHVYAVAKFKDGGHHVEVMTRAEVNSIRGRSKSSDDGPWVTDYIEMAKKTAIRRAFKYLPMSVELQISLAETVSTDGGTTLGEIIDSTAQEVDEREPAPSRTAEVISKMRGGQGNESGEAPESANEPPAPADPGASPVDERPNKPEKSLGSADAKPPADHKPAATTVTATRRTSAPKGSIFGGGEK